MQLLDLCSSMSSLSLLRKLQTALIASSICDVLAMHICSCYCRPANIPRQLVFKENLFIPRKCVVPSQWCKGSEAASSAGASGGEWGCKGRAVLGRSRVQIIWTLFVTLLHKYLLCGFCPVSLYQHQLLPCCSPNGFPLSRIYASFLEAAAVTVSSLQ